MSLFSFVIDFLQQPTSKDNEILYERLAKCWNTKFLKSYKLRLCSLTFWYMD